MKTDPTIPNPVDLLMVSCCAMSLGAAFVEPGMAMGAGLAVIVGGVVSSMNLYRWFRERRG